MKTITNECKTSLHRYGYNLHKNNNINCMLWKKCKSLLYFITFYKLSKIMKLSSPLLIIYISTLYRSHNHVGLRKRLFLTYYIWWNVKGLNLHTRSSLAIFISLLIKMLLIFFLFIFALKSVLRFSKIQLLILTIHVKNYN